MIVRRKCPFCREYQFEVERWGSNNLYLLKCLNQQTSASMWAELNIHNRFQQASVKSAKNSKLMSSYDKHQFDKLQIPFWRLMGLKPKQHEIEREKMLKWRGMTYGDAVLERDRLNNASHNNSINSVQRTLDGKEQGAASYQKTS